MLLACDRRSPLPPAYFGCHPQGGGIYFRRLPSVYHIISLAGCGHSATRIIGEATKRLLPQLSSLHPDIPWRRIAGLRDVLIHDYMGVDIKAVWEITQQNLPALKTRVEKILQELDHK